MRLAFPLRARRRYNYEVVKIFMPANREKPVIVPYIEHVPPDVTAGIFWFKNRDAQHWRDSRRLEHVLGKYIISDRHLDSDFANPKLSRNLLVHPTCRDQAEYLLFTGGQCFETASRQCHEEDGRPLIS